MPTFETCSEKIASFQNTLLFIDNAPGHTGTLMEMYNEICDIMPDTIISVLYLIDEGVILNFKSFFFFFKRSIIFR
jgi:hypothetical protein